MLIYDLAQPQELQGFIRRIQQEEEANQFTLSQFLPNQNIDEIEWRITKGQLRDQDAGVVRAWDAEAPIGNRQGIERMAGELPPLSKKMRLGEEERLRRRALETGNASGLIDQIYNDAANLSRSLLARIEMFRGEALNTGSITINENGFQQVVPFGRAGGHSVTASPLWSTTSSATPVADVRSWCNTYRLANGINPALILISSATLGHLMLNAEIRTLAASAAGTPALVTEATVRQVFSAFGLPPFVVYDTVVRINGTQTRVIPANRAIMLPPANEPLGRTFFGTTAESLELAEANQIATAEAPGMVSVVEKTFDPVAIWTKVAAIAFPVLVHPDLTFAATVGT